MAEKTEMAEMQKRVREIAGEKDFFILAHNYQYPEVQDVADFVGDSLVMAQKAVEAPNMNILVCGVWFMAETAAILNPDKRVFSPEPDSRCPMARMVDVATIRALKERNPGAPVVAYVNTTAEVKAESDVCCTSANAVDVVRSLDAGKVIFVPDVNLGLYVQKMVPEKEVILPAGYCPTHQGITREQIMALKEQHPDAEVLVHPECTPDVIDLADGVYSTQGMLLHARNSSAKEFIVGTEKEHAYRLKKALPEKEFYAIPTAVCPNMKKITLEKVLRALEKEVYEVKVPEDVAKRARRALERMLEIGRGEKNGR